MFEFIGAANVLIGINTFLSSMVSIVYRSRLSDNLYPCIVYGLEPVNVGNIEEIIGLYKFYTQIF